MKTKLNNPIVKAVIIALASVMMTITNGITGSWEYVNGDMFGLIAKKKWFLLVVFINLSFVVYFAVVENKKNKDKKNYLEEIHTRDRKISAYDKAVNWLTDIFDISQRDINKLTKNLIKSNELDLREWNIEMIATHICKGVYDTLVEVAERGEDFSVNIYLKETGGSDKRKIDYVTMIAHEGKYKKQVGIFGIRKLMIKNTDYCYIKQFTNNNPKETILPDWESIKKQFKFNGDSAKYKEEYSQYVGIPICCSGNNVIALLEIIAHGNSLLGSSEKEIQEIINKYILCFQYFVLLAMKVQKNMESKAEVLNREENTDE